VVESYRDEIREPRTVDIWKLNATLGS